VQNTPPSWWDEALGDDGVVVPGAILTRVGLPVPVMGPAQGYLLDLRAV
jgi:alpha-galactosidase